MAEHVSPLGRLLSRGAAWLTAVPASPAATDRAARTTGAKLQEWLRRYLPLEIVATATALIGGGLAGVMTASSVAIAYGGTWGENAGFYGLAFVRERRRLCDDASVASPSRQAVKNLVAEFGVAELADSFVTRPACMWAAGALLGNVTAGIVVGKLIGDAIFYGLAIVAYERRR